MKIINLVNTGLGDIFSSYHCRTILIIIKHHIDLDDVYLMIREH